MRTASDEGMLAPMRMVVVVIALGLGGCGALAHPVEVAGDCSLSLKQGPRQLTWPYRAEVSPTGEGSSDRPLLFDGGGWTGEVSIIQTQPGGEVVTGSLDAESFNAGSLVLALYEPGPSTSCLTTASAAKSSMSSPRPCLAKYDPAW